jgi:hypothetical protein
LEACSCESPTANRRISASLGIVVPGFSYGTFLTTRTKIRLFAHSTTLRHSIGTYAGHGILTMCPSDTVFTISLGPTNPSLIVIAKETLVFRREGISPSLRLLVPTFSLPDAPPIAHAWASSRTGTLSYRSRTS